MMRPFRIMLLIRTCRPDPGGFVRYLVSSPAVDRLGWILDGPNGAPDFAALVPPEAFAERVRQRAVAFAAAP
jgi:hypothetical protein